MSTDQDGNFRVGDYFKIDQATGRAILNANAFDLAGLTSLKLGSIFQLGGSLELSYFDFASNYFKHNTKALNLIHGIKDLNVVNNKYNSLQTYLPKLR